VGQAQPDQDVTARADRTALAPQVAAVEAARARFGHSLSQLEQEVRAQIGYSVERILWKVAVAGVGVAAVVGVQKAMTAAWRAARKTEPPINPAAKSTGWGDAIAWTVATGVGIAAAKLVATRGIAAGWEKATGTPPPLE
jgi:hypothetical protein